MEKSKTEVQAPVYTLAQLLESKKYSGMRDVLSAILDDKQKYTTEQADRAINKFMKGKVK